MLKEKYTKAQVKGLNCDFKPINFTESKSAFERKYDSFIKQFSSLNKQNNLYTALAYAYFGICALVRFNYVYHTPNAWEFFKNLTHIQKLEVVITELAQVFLIAANHILIFVALVIVVIGSSIMNSGD